MNTLVRIGQRLPQRWRLWLLHAPFAPTLRRWLNRYRSESQRLVIVDLAPPLEGHRMKLDWLINKAYVFGVYEPDVVEAMHKHVQAGMVAVDCGAHIGYHTLLLAKLVGASGKVYAFEPLPENFAVLCENIAINGYRNVTAENKAVAEQTGCLRLARGRWQPKDRDPLTSVSRLSEEGDLEVAAVALDDYFVDKRVDFIKVDVEGAEERVLKGARNLLSRCRPALIVSIHGFSEDHPALHLLRELGYRCQPLNEWGAEWHVLCWCE